MTRLNNVIKHFKRMDMRLNSLAEKHLWKFIFHDRLTCPKYESWSILIYHLVQIVLIRVSSSFCAAALEPAVSAEVVSY